MNGKLVRSVGDLEDALAAAAKAGDGITAASSKLYDFDHIYNPQQQGVPGEARLQSPCSCFGSNTGLLLQQPWLASHLPTASSPEFTKYLPSCVAGAVHAILYGPPGTSCFADMDRSIRLAVEAAAAKDGGRPVVYAHRPLLGEACLSGEVRSAGLKSCIPGCRTPGSISEV